MSELERIERAIALLEAYEQPVYRDQCDEIVHDLASITEVIKRAVQNSNRNIKEEIYGKHALSCADEARLQLAAFMPYVSRNVTMSGLRQRQQAIRDLHKFVQAAKDALAAASNEGAW